MSYDEFSGPPLRTWGGWFSELVLWVAVPLGILMLLLSADDCSDLGCSARQSVGLASSAPSGRLEPVQGP